MRVIVIIVCTLIFSSHLNSAFAEGIKHQSGMISGNEYLSSGLSKRSYVTGIIDGIFIGPVFSETTGDKSLIWWLQNCLAGMENTQMVAIIDKYMKEHPEEWHEDMHVIVYRAFANLCPDSPLHKMEK